MSNVMRLFPPSFRAAVAAAVLMAMSGAVQASVVTVNFDFTDGNRLGDSLGYTDPVTGLSLDVTGFLYTAPASINQQVKVNQQNNLGLGVCGTWPVGTTGNCAGPQLDGGGGVNDNELLKFTFSGAVSLVSIAFRNNDQNEPFDFFLGEPLSLVASYPMPGPPSRIFNFTEPFPSGFVFGIGLQGNSDQARIAGFTVNYDTAPIPLPAAGFLLLGALGGLAFLRRRQQHMT